MHDRSYTEADLLRELRSGAIQLRGCVQRGDGPEALLCAGHALHGGLYRTQLALQTQSHVESSHQAQCQVQDLYVPQKATMNFVTIIYQAGAEAASLDS